MEIHYFLCEAFVIKSLFDKESSLSSSLAHIVVFIYPYDKDPNSSTIISN